MSVRSVSDHLVTHRVNEQDWLIENQRFPADDARHLVAFVHEEQRTFEVIWVQGFPLPSRYATARKILDDVTEWMMPSHRSTRPIPIPHFPPMPRTAVPRH